MLGEDGKRCYRSGGGGVGYITDLTAAHIQTSQQARDRQPVSRTWREQLARTLPLLFTTDTEELASQLPLALLSSPSLHSKTAAAAKDTGENDGKADRKCAQPLKPLND